MLQTNVRAESGKCLAVFACGGNLLTNAESPATGRAELYATAFISFVNDMVALPISNVFHICGDQLNTSADAKLCSSFLTSQRR
jgi:hypothetical protein